MAGKMVEFPSNGGKTPGYLATPKTGKGPGVLVIQEWWGLVGHIKNVCDRFAADGFSALAPDMFHGKTADEPDAAEPAGTSGNECSGPLESKIHGRHLRFHGTWRLVPPAEEVLAFRDARGVNREP